MSTPGKERSWGAVVYETSDKAEGGRRFLLVKLASGNHWDHPKGHPESLEDPREAARREIREEGGVDVRFVDGFLSTAEWILPDGRPKEVGYFLAERAGNAPTGGPEGEILDREWLTYTEARERLSYDTGRRVLDEAVDFLGR